MVKTLVVFVVFCCHHSISATGSIARPVILYTVSTLSDHSRPGLFLLIPIDDNSCKAWLVNLPLKKWVVFPFVSLAISGHIFAPPLALLRALLPFSVRIPAKRLRLSGLCVVAHVVRQAAFRYPNIVGLPITLADCHCSSPTRPFPAYLSVAVAVVLVSASALRRMKPGGLCWPCPLTCEAFSISVLRVKETSHTGRARKPSLMTRQVWLSHSSVESSSCERDSTPSGVNIGQSRSPSP